MIGVIKGGEGGYLGDRIGVERSARAIEKIAKAAVADNTIAAAINVPQSWTMLLRQTGQWQDDVH